MDLFLNIHLKLKKQIATIIYHVTTLSIHIFVKHEVIFGKCALFHKKKTHFSTFFLIEKKKKLDSLR